MDNENKTKKNNGPRNLYTSELVLYIIFGCIWLTGLVFAVLGAFAYNYGKLSNNSLYSLQKSFASFFHMQGVMDFRLWGTVVMAVMMVAFLITVFAYSSKSDKAAAEERRRAERMRILMESDEASK